jgi:hypothetical protein
MLLRKHRTRGQIIVVISIAIPVLIGAMALCVDVMMFYWHWANLQKAADAAALAGAHYLPNDPETATAEAVNYAGFNAVPESEIVSITVAPDNRSIRVVLERMVPYYFGRVLGLLDGLVRVAATAAVQNVHGARGLVPLGVNCPSGNPDECNLQKGVEHTLKLDMEGPGNWFPLDFGEQGGGANDYRNDIINGCDCYVELGDSIWVETGTMVGPTRQGFEARVEAALSDPAYADSTWENPVPGDPRIIQVPLADFTEVQGKMMVVVTGFAEFWISGVYGNGSVEGIFLNMVDSQNVPSADAPEGGSLVPILIE